MHVDSFNKKTNVTLAGADDESPILNYMYICIYTCNT